MGAGRTLNCGTDNNPSAGCAKKNSAPEASARTLPRIECCGWATPTMLKRRALVDIRLFLDTKIHVGFGDSCLLGRRVLRSFEAS